MEMYLVVLTGTEDTFLHLLTKEEFNNLPAKEDLCVSVGKLNIPTFSTVKEMMEYCDKNNVEIVGEEHDVFY